MRKVTLGHGKTVKRFHVLSAADWTVVASYVAAKLKPGHVIALFGPLGSGKTTFVQALAKELDIRRVPPSPTFALMRQYAVPKSSPYYKKISRIIHVDAYRIEDERDLAMLDLDEELKDGRSILVIEWAEKVKNWLKRHPVIAIRISAYYGKSFQRS